MTPLRRPSLAMVDVDGTLRGPEGWLPGAPELLRLLRDEGVPIALCSGRPAHTLAALADEVGGIDLVAGGGGAAVLARGGAGWSRVADTVLDPELVRRLQDECAIVGLELWAYSPERWLVHGPSRGVDRERDIIGFGADECPDFTDEPAVVKLMMLPVTGDARHDEFVAGLPSRYEGVAVVSSAPGYLDVISADAFASKGGAALLAHRGLDWGQVLAIGDGPNDVGMLSKAGLAVCLPSLTRRALPDARGTVLEAADRWDAARQLRQRWELS